MGKLIYLMNVSLDGYVATADGGLDWSVVDDELHAWFNDEIREAGAFLYGRRMWEVMSAYWPTAEADPDATPVMLDFARIWNAKPKIVFSSTLSMRDWASAEWGGRSLNARLVRVREGGEVADPADALASLKDEFDGDLDVGGPTLAAAFIRRNLVDEYRLVVHPAVLGAGLRFFPPQDDPVDLRLTETRRFGSGAVLLSYVPA